ncbi:serine hydrolase domain-containing protein [Micromonospora okii]|uniref:serine hydrolase domain-containing protein n=1 Tax=Micromonospora okii TaxID=1182970 RepID=UPI001E3F8E3B|nr:serine hydrolase domain-containing protein [Micromonospora okii]
MSTSSVTRGAVLLAEGDRLVVTRYAGLADAASGEPSSARTRFQIASISKNMTATAVLLLAGRGALDVTDPVDRWVPGCPPAWRSITLHHLLTHTSGLGHWEDHPGVDLAAPADPDDLVAAFAAVPPLFAPGTAWRYSSPGYVLLARAVERAADRPYREFLAEEVFAPHGMTGSFAGSGAGHDDVAVGHSGDRPVPSWDLDTVSMGTGDVWCTAGDLLAWLDGWRDARLLDPALLARMTTAHAPTGSAATGYGYGCFVGPLAGERAVHHSGHNAGFKAFAAWLPDSGRRLVLLTNDDEYPVDSAGMERLLTTD